MGRKNFKRGSAKKFVKLEHWLMETDAYLCLSTDARCLHLELIKRFTGSNNGKIYLPTREAGEKLNIHRNTASKRFAELERAGFIAESKGYNLGVEGKGRSWEWRLTHLPCNAKPPTFDFKKTKPLHTRSATLAHVECQAEVLEEEEPPKVAHVECQGNAHPWHTWSANITSSHRLQVLRWRIHRRKGMCGKAMEIAA